MVPEQLEHDAISQDHFCRHLAMPTAAAGLGLPGANGCLQAAHWGCKHIRWKSKRETLGPGGLCCLSALGPAPGGLLCLLLLHACFCCGWGGTLGGGKRRREGSCTAKEFTAEPSRAELSRATSQQVDSGPAQGCLQPSLLGVPGRGLQLALWVRTSHGRAWSPAGQMGLGLHQSISSAAAGKAKAKAQFVSSQAMELWWCSGHGCCPPSRPGSDGCAAAPRSHRGPGNSPDGSQQHRAAKWMSPIAGGGKEHKQLSTNRQTAACEGQEGLL